MDEDNKIDEKEKVDETAVGGHEQCEARSTEYKLGWQRAVADYQNLKKETEARRAEWVQMSEQQILEEFLPVYDHFKAAFYHHPELNVDQKNIQNWIDGIGYIMKQFGDILKNHGVEEIKTVGEKFDPVFHESAGEQEGVESGLILKEVSGGYKMGKRVIKPARVIITK
jgi:molecular chaperone GrpE